MAGKQPNILIIWGDDVGMWNISAYHRGMTGGRHPTLVTLLTETQMTWLEQLSVLPE